MQAAGSIQEHDALQWLREAEDLLVDIDMLLSVEEKAWEEASRFSARFDGPRPCRESPCQGTARA